MIYLAGELNGCWNILLAFYRFVEPNTGCVIFPWCLIGFQHIRLYALSQKMFLYWDLLQFTMVHKSSVRNFRERLQRAIPYATS